MKRVKQLIRLYHNRIKRISEMASIYLHYLLNINQRFGLDYGVYKNEFKKYMKCFLTSNNQQVIYRRMRDFFSTTIFLYSDHLILDENKNVPILLVAVKNELARMKLFMEHYQRLGVRQLIIIDNDSTDGTREFVASQPNTRVYLVKEPFQSQKKEAWIEKVLALTGYDRWYIVADSDELIDYIGSEQHSIEELIRLAVNEGKVRLQGYMVDMYADMPLFSVRCEPDEILQHIELFDQDSYYEASPGAIKGGPRGRVFGLQNVLSKQSIFNFKSDMLFDSHCIYSNGVKYSEESCYVLRHYKFLEKDRALYKEHVEKRDYYNNSQEYRIIMGQVDDSQDLKLVYDNSVTYKNSNSLSCLPFLHWKTWDN